ncbi:TetR/AcrR family transcriptional regulator [Chitinophaga arvensicola]|uniref:DNA-binding transcriptional regulator, AcrR family n=1 Tax=Chitinophaga arvensicola TaxID=29529 RepID=A0A1I0SBJ4_9BACT|nr:TetR/AcrR family transcriptional regulator [Chitinophaga arvensicola]SEW54029.1 DNA-binding transcriptional regulator, AcrR family [Chitinophaga arvensicola]
MKKKISDPKQRLLETATSLFYNQGYHATGINQVIEEAGVARASLYTHYESKESLLLAFLHQRHTDWMEGLQRFTDKATKPKEKIAAAFDFLFDNNEKEHFRGCAFLNILSETTDNDTAVLAVIQDHKKGLRAFLGEILAKEKQGIKDHVYLLFESAIVESQLYRHQWPVQEARKMAVGLL